MFGGMAYTLDNRFIDRDYEIDLNFVPDDPEAARRFMMEERQSMVHGTYTRPTRTNPKKVLRRRIRNRMARKSRGRNR